MAVTAILSGIFILILALFISMNLTNLHLPLVSGFVDLVEYKEKPKNQEKIIKCGVDYPVCADGKRCINGFCKNDTIPELRGTGLRIVP
jgi:hypothetical protein